MEKLIELTCDVCGNKFSKRLTEHNRCLKRGLKRTFCSSGCCGKGKGVGFAKGNPYGNAANLKKGSLRDEFSPFRFHMKVSKMHKGQKDHDLTLSDLKEQWEDQQGICPYTGWELKNAVSTNLSDKLPHTPDRASLDRINSSKGYVKGNVHYIALIAQYAKNGWDDSVISEFAKSVVESMK